MSDKATKAEAHYRPGNAVRKCAGCMMFRPPGTCVSVKGDISPEGLCDYFERKKPAK